MKNLIFSLILSFTLISVPLKLKASNIKIGNKSLSILAGSPFYGFASFCFYKASTSGGGPFDLEIPFMTGIGVISALTGVTTSLGTYIALEKNGIVLEW